jgi:hypothetical protein
MSAAEEHDVQGNPLPSSANEPHPTESLTDVIDRLDRKAFERALDRRHCTPSYREVIESAQLVRRTKSS